MMLKAKNKHSNIIALFLTTLIFSLVSIFHFMPPLAAKDNDKDNKYKESYKEFPIDVKASITSLNSIIPLQSNFGKLKFKGGLTLSSDYKNFGGISGLVIKKDGSRILSVTDQGYWFETDLIYDGDENLINIKNPKMRVMRTGWGYLNKSKTRGDVEALSPIGYGWSGNTPLYASFERRHRIVYFKAKKDLKKSKGSAIIYPSKKILNKRNSGFEAIVKYPNSSKLKGALLAIGNKEKKKDYINAYLLNQRSKKLKIKAHGELKITDSALRKNLDLLLLERKFSFDDGIGFQIRRIPIKQVAKALKSKEIVDGDILISATLPLNIDNFEGIAVHENSTENTIITIISDDNFSNIQRTIIYQFEFVDSDKNAN